MHQVKYGLFFDNHTQMENPDVGRDFDPEYFTDQLKACGVDYLGFHARCNVGMAYYDTAVGTRHPALKYDLFGALAECCRKKNIAIVAYFNGGISTMELLEHPEWRRKPFPGLDNFGKVSPSVYTVCYNSTFRHHLIAMVREVAAKYPVDGFFIDCVGSYPCVCPRCVRIMKERGFDFRDIEAVREFARLSALDYCREIAAAVHEALPAPMLYFNGPVFGTARELDTFFDCECLPTSKLWGYEFLPIMAHAIRNIKPGTQVLNMTGRFYEWGDFGGLRTKDSLEYDLFYGLAHGMRPNIGGHIHPRGDRDQAVFDRIREVYRDLRVFDPWYENSRNLADVAVVYPADDAALRKNPAIRSCVRMLDELKLQFDVVFADCEKSWDDYRLLILSENVKVTEALARRIREHLGRGGAFFACGKLAAESFPAELGVECLGDSGLDPVYFKMHDELSAGIPDMPLSLYASAVKAQITTARSIAPLVKPYYNLEWTGTHAICYTPPEKETAWPFLTVNGRCVWCSGDLFSGYTVHAALHLRDIFRNAVAQLLPEPFFQTVKLPAAVRVAVTEQPNRMNVHVIAYAPEKRADTAVVEDPLAVANGEFLVRTGNRPVASVYLAPDRAPVEFRVEGDYIRVKLPVFEGYTVVVFEYGSK